jgi:hypothetical protein
MDNPEEAVGSNVKYLYPEIPTRSDREKDLLTYFIQMMAENKKNGIEIDSVYFFFTGTRTTEEETYDTTTTHYCFDPDRNTLKEMSYLAFLMQSEVSKRIQASHEDVE